MGHVNKVSHVFTLSHVAEMLGEDEDGCSRPPKKWTPRMASYGSSVSVKTG
ncbi:hypothetical protein ACVWZM_002961 [Bradyrhizobium sp. USDA 4501]